MINPLNIEIGTELEWVQPEKGITALGLLREYQKIETIIVDQVKGPLDWVPCARVVLTDGTENIFPLYKLEGFSIAAAEKGETE